MARAAARQTAQSIIESVTGPEFASSLATCFSTLATTGKLTVASAGAAVAPMLGLLAVFGGSTWLRCRSEQRRDEEVDARFAELADILGLVSHNVADAERRLAALLERVDASRRATPEAVVEALRGDLMTLGFDTNDRVRELATKVDVLLDDRWEIKIRLDWIEAKGDARHEEIMTALEEVLRRQVQSPTGEPAGAPALSDEDRALLARAKASQDDMLRAKAAVVERDETTFRELRDRHAADAYQNAYEWATLEGDHHSLQGRHDDAIPHYERALALRPDRWEAVRNLAFALCSSQRGDKAANCRRAIDLLNNGVAAHPRERDAAAWASLQNELGTAWAERHDGDRTVNLREAVECYERALEVFSREASPADWALTQNNLGTAWAERHDGERAANLREAIACYERALEVRAREAFPADWALTQNNLGNAWSARHDGERAANLRKAIACYERALEVRTREAFPADWAMTQNNLGVAWSERHDGDRAANLRKAIACYERALEVYTREGHSAGWAMTQNNLGNACSQLHDADPAANLSKAVACYQRALEVYTPEAFQNHHELVSRNLQRAQGLLEAWGDPRF